MKKLTAGIFTVLMGLVSVNAANAAVASKGYVDTKAAALATAAQTAAETTAAGALSSAKSELEGKINAKVAQSEYNTKIQALEAADATFAKSAKMTEELAKKQNNLTVTGGILTWDAEKSELGLTGIASDSSVTELKGTVDTLNGSATTEGSVKKQIADAVAAEVTRSNTYADQAEADAIATAKSYADGLAGNYDAAGSAAQALTDAKAYTDDLANGAVKSNTEAIAALDTTYVSESEMSTFKTSNAEAIADAKKAGTDASAALETYKTANDAALAGVKTTAEKGVADAATAKSAADAAQAAADAAQADATQALQDAAAAQATANAAIPKPQGECSNPTNKCVLTFNNSAYTWEVIERATGETGF